MRRHDLVTLVPPFLRREPNDDSMLVLDLVSGDTLARVPVQSSPDGVTYSSIQR